MSTPRISFSFLLDEDSASQAAILMLTDEIGDAIQDLALDSGIALMDMCEEDEEHGLFVPVDVSVEGLNYCAECAADELQAIEDGENESARFRWNDEILDVEQLSRRIDEQFDEIEASNPAAIAWDGCHTILILKDARQVHTIPNLHHYQVRYANGDGHGDVLRRSLDEWFDQSCGLVSVSEHGPDGKTFIPRVFGYVAADDEAEEGDPKVAQAFAEIVAELVFGGDNQ